MRVGTGMALRRASATLQRALQEVEVPFLVQHGSADQVVAPQGSEQLFRAARSADKTLQLFPGAPMAACTVRNNARSSDCNA